MATAIARASTSHGNHVNCEPRNLALKKPARRNLSLRVTYSVAPIPGLRRAPSVDYSGQGSEMVRAVERAAWALRNDARRSSVH